MIKKYILVLLAILVLSLTGCKNKEKSTIESTIYNNDKYPSFLVDNVNTSCGEDLTVYVKLINNPGFLTMAMNIEYDSSAMDLIEVENGLDYENYNFVGPKNMNSLCNASWYALDLPEKIVDGTLLELHFKILDEAKKGKYKLKVSRSNNGGVVDRNKEPLIVNEALGYITVE